MTIDVVVDALNADVFASIYAITVELPETDRTELTFLFSLFELRLIWWGTFGRNALEL